MTIPSGEDQLRLTLVVDKSEMEDACKKGITSEPVVCVVELPSFAMTRSVDERGNRFAFEFWIVSERNVL